jgi:hypothetical protein
MLFWQLTDAYCRSWRGNRESLVPPENRFLFHEALSRIPFENSTLSRMSGALLVAPLEGYPERDVKRAGDSQGMTPGKVRANALDGQVRFGKVLVSILLVLALSKVAARRTFKRVKRTQSLAAQNVKISHHAIPFRAVQFATINRS